MGQNIPSAEGTFQLKRTLGSAMQMSTFSLLELDAQAVARPKMAVVSHSGIVKSSHRQPTSTSGSKSAW
jgi:hypothetical protein